MVQLEFLKGMSGYTPFDGRAASCFCCFSYLIHLCAVNIANMLMLLAWCCYSCSCFTFTDVIIAILIVCSCKGQLKCTFINLQN
uniref:Uncharacterized protein n=1 Tax=Arundo donax TaxID=35708 RepID=A0A0A9E1F9_ARUDO